MAKISARGATEVARCKARFETNESGAEVTGRVSTFVLRSDGVILKKGPAEQRYTVFGKKLLPSARHWQGLVDALVRRGYVVVAS